MFILYVDSSGTPEHPGDPQVPLYAMVGICVHEGTWFALERRVAGLKGRYALPGIDFELHAKDFCVTIGEQSQIPDFEQLDRPGRRQAVLALRNQRLAQLVGPQKEARKKKYRNTDPFVHLTRAERSQLLEDALDLVGSHDGIRLFGEVVDKAHLSGTTGETDSISHCFAQVVSRFDKFLTYYNASPRIGLDKGLLMMDREPSHERTILELFRSYRQNGHPWGPVNHVIEAPFFLDSSTAAGVQVVDICAYAVRRYVERADRQGSPEEQNFLRIYHKFDRAGPRLHGLRHYCARGTCPCRICRDRGHFQVTPAVPLS